MKDKFVEVLSQNYDPNVPGSKLWTETSFGRDVGMSTSRHLTNLGSETSSDGSNLKEGMVTNLNTHTEIRDTE